MLRILKRKRMKPESFPQHLEILRAGLGDINPKEGATAKQPLGKLQAEADLVRAALIEDIAHRRPDSPSHHVGRLGRILAPDRRLVLVSP